MRCRRDAQQPTRDVVDNAVCGPRLATTSEETCGVARKKELGTREARPRRKARRRAAAVRHTARRLPRAGIAGGASHRQERLLRLFRTARSLRARAPRTRPQLSDQREEHRAGNKKSARMQHAAPWLTPERHAAARVVNFGQECALLQDERSGTRKRGEETAMRQASTCVCVRATQ